MKLMRSTSYAVGVLLRIDGLAADGQVTAARIAEGCRFPPRFLYRVLRRLVAAGLLRGTSGPGGGYSLARKSERITLLAIVESVEGKPSASVLKPVRANQRGAVAKINRISAQNARRFASELRKLTLADLASASRAASDGESREKSKVDRSCVLRHADCTPRKIRRIGRRQFCATRKKSGRSASFAATRR